MGCTSAKQVSAVPNGEEGQNKAYSNGDLLSGQSVYCFSLETHISVAPLCSSQLNFVLEWLVKYIIIV